MTTTSHAHAISSGLPRATSPGLCSFLCTVIQELSRMKVSEWEKTVMHSLSLLEQILEQKENGEGATKASIPCRTGLGCGAPWVGQGYSLDTSLWLERLWPVPAVRDTIPRSRTCSSHYRVVLHRQDAPVPCYYKDRVFPGFLAPFCRPGLSEQEGKGHFCPIILILDKTQITLTAKHIG